MKTYAFKELTSSVLAEIAVIHDAPPEHAFWDELGRKELGEHDRLVLGIVLEKLLYYKTQRVNEATIWARAIYPMLMLAESGRVRAWSGVPLAAAFGDVEIRGEADGALASSMNEEIELPYLVVVEAKRGVGAVDPMDQLLGAMLCAARLNERAGGQADEIYGCYTVADVWTFFRGRFDWTAPRPVMSLLSSREYMEKTEGQTILAILESIVGKFQT
jgi:hypothetical protein